MRKSISVLLHLPLVLDSFEFTYFPFKKFTKKPSRHINFQSKQVTWSGLRGNISFSLPFHCLPNNKILDLSKLIKTFAEDKIIRNSTDGICVQKKEKTLREKEKMLVTSIFSFSRKVFKCKWGVYSRDYEGKQWIEKERPGKTYKA